MRSHQATAAVIEALRGLNDVGSAPDAGKTWLAGQASEVTEETAWGCGLLGFDPFFASTSCTDLQYQMQVGGWGSGLGYPIEVLDTVLSLDALAITGLSDVNRIQRVIGVLLSAQKEDGGWGYGNNFSNVYLTAEVLGALVRHRALFPLEDAIQRALAKLKGEYRAGGAIGDGLIETAMAYRGAIEAGENVATSFPGTSSYLHEAQALDGSWDEDEYTTAIVLGALSLEKPNLVIWSSDLVFSQPFPREGEVVAINALVRNAGPAAAESVQVRFYDGDPLNGGLLIGDAVTLALIPAYGSVNITTVWNTAGRAGNRYITVQADPDNAITEIFESDNAATAEVKVATIPDFVLGQGDVQISPAFPSPADLITITATVRNAGQISAEGFTATLYDGPPGVSGSSLGTNTVPLFGAGTEAVLSWEGYLTAGTHTLTVVADATQTITEMSEANNSASASVIVYPAEADLADIEISAFSAQPSVVSEGQTSVVHVIVHNIGRHTASGIGVELWEADGTGSQSFIGSTQVPSLSIGSQAALNWTLSLPVGTYQLTARVDSAGAIRERDENNNEGSCTLRVLPSNINLPDLELRAADLGYLPSDPTSLDEVTVQAVLRNLGNAEAVRNSDYAISVALFDGDPVFGGALLTQFEVETVTPGAEIQINLASTLSVGSHDIFLVADAEYIVDELAETNNAFVFHIEVYPPVPDLTASVDDLSFSPSLPKEGESVTIAATVRNTSSIAAQNVRIVLNEGSGESEVTLLDMVIPELSGHSWTTVQAVGQFSLGEHFISLDIDPENSIQERSESNNTTTNVVRVLTPPDLSVSAEDMAVTPAAPFSDERISFAATIRNHGEGRADQVRVGFYDGDPSMGGVLLGEEHFVYRIYGQSTVRIEKSFFLSPGMHQLHILVDSRGTVVESSEANNRASVQVDVQARPDLAFIGIPTFSPAIPAPDQPFQIMANISNSGIASLADVKVSFYDGDPESGGNPIADPQVIPSLPGGEIRSVNVTYVLAGGYHEIYAVVDSARLVYESNERNNIVFAPVVLNSPLPDLVLKSSETTYLPFAPKSGSSITFDSQIWNYSSGIVQGVSVRWYDGTAGSGILLGSQAVDIAAGSSVHVTSGVVLGAGDHQIHIVIDPDNALIEANEANNVETIAITVADAPGWYDDCGNPLNQSHLIQGDNSALQGFAELSEEVRSVSTHPTSVTYTYSQLSPDAIYRVTASFLEQAGAGRQQKMSVDGILLSSSFDVPDDKPLVISAILPHDTYQDGTATISIERLAGANAIVSQVWVVRETGSRENAIARGLNLLEQAATDWNNSAYVGWDNGTGAYLTPLALSALQANGLTTNSKFQAVLNKVFALQMPDGSWGQNAQHTSRALTSLIESGFQADGPAIRAGVAWLRRQANADGGWGLSKGYVSQPIYTGMVITALMRCGGSKTDSEIVAGVQYLKSKQNSTGYWGHYAGDADIVWVGPWPLIALGLSTSSSDQSVVRALARYQYLTDRSGYFVQVWYDILRVYFYLGGTSSNIQTAVNQLHSFQKPDGGWTEYADTYNALYVTFNALEMLGKFGVSTVYETRGIAWLDQYITDNGTYVSTLQELDEYNTAWTLIAMTKVNEYASQSIVQKAERTLVDYQQSSGFWSYRFFSTNPTWYETSGLVLQALAASPYVATGESAKITKAKIVLKNCQNSDGGWGSNITYATNLVSTNYILKGMIDTGYSVTDPVITKAINWLLGKRGIDGGWGNVFDTACSARTLMVEAKHAQAVRDAINWLKNSQNADGGWGSMSGQTSTVKETSFALIALSEAGETGIEVARGVAWMIAAQNADGGWGSMTRDSANNNGTTAIAVWALSVARFNMGIDLELLFNKPWYYPVDLVSMVVNPLNRTADEIDLSGWLRDQYGSSVALPVIRAIDSFSTDFLVPSDALAGADTVNFSAFSDDAQGAVAGSFVVRSAIGVLPDLSASAADILLSTDHPQAGDSVGIHAAVHNLSMIDAQDVVIRLYRGDPDSGGTPIGGDILLDRIAGQGSREVTVEWVAEPTVTALFLIVDPDNYIVEGAEDNNQASKSIYVSNHIAMPDLSISAGDITSAPGSPCSGEQVIVSATVHNAGDAVTVQVPLRLFDADPRVGGRKIGDVQLPALNSSGSTSVQFVLDTASLSGRQYVYAVVDPDNSLAEISESNNQAFSFFELRPAALPDLDIPAGGLVFSPTQALEGAVVSIAVQVWNRGLDASGAEIALYDGDPESGGTLLVPLQTIPGILEANSSRTVTFSWSTTGKSGNHRIFALVDPNSKIAEYHEDNNSHESDLAVVSSHFAIEVSPNGSVFGPNTPVQIQITVHNSGPAEATALLIVEIDDSRGERVAEILSSSLDLAADEARLVPSVWNTGVVLDGSYHVAAKLLQGELTAAAQDAPITITPDLSVTPAVVTDKIEYSSNETARITWSATSGSANHNFTNLTATLTVEDSSCAIIFTEQRTVASLVRGQRLTFATYWGVTIHQPGSYPLRVRITDGTVLLAQATGTLSISAAADPKTLLAGAISAAPQVIFSGDAESITYSIHNVGNRDLSLVQLSIKVVSTDQQIVHAELTDAVPLTMGAQYDSSQSISTAGFSAADYLALLVADIDGVSATLAGTYFRIQGAPSAPSVNSPSAGSKVATMTPQLIVNNAADPNAWDKLTYFFELYADSGLTQPIASAGPLAEGQGTAGWQVAFPLIENTYYWWRCRAYDAWAYGEWMAPASFFVNTINDPPGPPTADHPLEGQSVAVLQPLLVVKDAFDPDTDSLTYNFRIATDPGMTDVVASEVGVFEGQGTTAWQVNAPLAENNRYWWSAQADDWLIEGPWMSPVSFFVNTANEAPTAPVPISPAEGAVTGTSVTLEVQNASDPDSPILSYSFEVDSEPAFTSATLITSALLSEGAGTTSWTSPAPFAENTHHYWRAKANDGQADSPWSTVSSFFVNAVNEPPSTPSLANPSNQGEVIVLQPTLSVHNAVDPDGDALTYEFEIYADAELTQMVVSVTGFAQGAGSLTSWDVSQPLLENTSYWWRARAFDGFLFSGWMPEAAFFVNIANDPPSAPTLVAPANGASVALLQPVLIVTTAVDPEGAPLTYQFEVYGDSALTILAGSASGIEAGSGTPSWALSSALQDNHQYWWRCRAFDGDRSGTWMPTATFTVHMSAASIVATIDFDPDTLNLDSNGTWVTVYIELPAGYNVRNINPTTVKLNGVVPAETKPIGYGDDDKDGIADIMLKFRRSAVEAILTPGEHVVVQVTGKVGAAAFEGVDIIRVIH